MAHLTASPWEWKNPQRQTRPNVPFGILESGGSQHSIWKPLSQESQKSISSWIHTHTEMCQTRKKIRCNLHNTSKQHPAVKVSEHKQRCDTIKDVSRNWAKAISAFEKNLQHSSPESDRNCMFCIRCIAIAGPWHLQSNQWRTSGMMDGLWGEMWNKTNRL